jgi:hypothetical protein
VTAKDVHEWVRKRLAEEEKELADFKNAIAKHGLRVWHCDANGERDVTDENIRHLEATVAEYRAMMRED